MRDTAEHQARNAVAASISAAGASGNTDATANAEAQALGLAGIAIYEWNIATDTLMWSGAVHRVFGVDAVQVNTAYDFSSGRGYARHVDPEAGVSRYDTVMTSDKTDRGEGVNFSCEYVVVPPGSDEAVWVEDTGAWFVGDNGRPGRVVGTVRNITARKHRERHLTYLASFDELTGNINRTKLRETLSQTIAYCERFDRASAFMMAGIDNLAMINDAYGFDVADQVIVAVSRRLKEQLRQSDTLGRVAGNKFGVVLANCGEDEMAYTAERLMRAVRETVIETGSGPVSASVSIGCVALPRCARNATEALARAEETLDAAKSTRRGAYTIYQLSEQRESSRRRNIQLADQIVAALNEDRMKLAYQPIVSAKTGQADLHECLLRMVKPDGEVVSAGAFISVAEKLGLVRLIDHRVLELTVRTLTENPDVHLAMNVSGMTAVDRSWLESMTGYVRDHIDIAPRLIVEITETVALHELEESARFVRELRDLGCRVAIDDFGAGYTSFRNLKALDVDMVKIDGSFVKGLVRSRDDQLFVQTLVHLAKNFGLPVVAEWVGNEDEVTLLRAYGVEYLQGFYLGEPTMAPVWGNAAAARETA